MARTANPILPQALVAAATEIFAERGLAATRVSDITDRAGASKGAFYLVFKSKEALYLGITREFMDDMLALMARYDALLCAPFASESFDEIAAIDAALCAFLWQRRAALAMVLEGAHGTPCAFIADEFLDTIQRHMLDSITRQVQAQGDCGAGLHLDPDFAAMMATGLLYMYARRIVRATDEPEFASHITDFRRMMAYGSLPAAQRDALQAAAGGSFPIHAAGEVPT
jgi:AcrR family transcriptional regulator